MFATYYVDWFAVQQWQSSKDHLSVSSLLNSIWLLEYFLEVIFEEYPLRYGIQYLNVSLIYN
jgi:hypothetical protein